MVMQKTLARAQATYREFPNQFWVLILGTFIDRLGGALIFPFFTLYITEKFGIGMTQVGVIFAAFSISGIAGSMVGGALTDRLGRKRMLLFGLVVSALSSVLMGLVNELWLFILVAVFVGLFANAGGPAQQAMVADLLPEEKRAQGFGIIRVIANLAVTIGPAIGGFLAGQSYLTLFICDAVASLITAAIVFFVIQESRPEPQDDAPVETMAQTFGGYFKVLRDVTFVLFIGASMLMTLVYVQMNSTLAVYLRDTHEISPQGFGAILSLNAGMVVLFQFSITRRISKYRPLLVMTVGTLLYAIGFAMYGFVAAYPLFLLAMVIITIGEMFVAPVGQAIVAQFAPADMRGRYMAVYGFSWVIPSIVGTFLAGLVLDNFDPRWLWYVAGVVGLAAAAAYALLEQRAGHSAHTMMHERLDVLQALEEGRLSAAEAASRLQELPESGLTTLAASAPAQPGRSLRIRVSDLATGMMKADLTLPMGLVNTVLYMGGKLSTDLEDLDLDRLKELIAHSEQNGGTGSMEMDDQRVEISLE